MDKEVIQYMTIHELAEYLYVNLSKKYLMCEICQGFHTNPEDLEGFKNIIDLMIQLRDKQLKHYI